MKTARVAHQRSVCWLWNKKKNKEDPRTNDLFLFAFCFGKCLSMLIFSSHLWQRSQLVRGHDARVLAGVKTTFFQWLLVELGTGCRYQVWTCNPYVNGFSRPLLLQRHALGHTSVVFFIPHFWPGFSFLVRLLWHFSSLQEMYQSQQYTF